jgi:hypothetical protein
MIPTVKTITFKDELVHQTSVPMLFLCDDFNSYYCKSQLDNPDHDFLLYELIGNRMGNYFGIATPEIALVTFDEDSLGSAGYLQKNYNLENGDIIFGSKHIGQNDHIDKTGRFSVKHRKQFSKLNNPEDILKITILDIHLNNVDRNEENYNLLFQTNEARFYAIDHSALFGGPAMKGFFAPKGSPALGGKLLGSFLLKNILKFLSFEQIDRIVEEYFSNCDERLGTEIEGVFDMIPESWTISESLMDRMLTYSCDETRLKFIRLLLINRLYEIKKK